MRSVPLLFFLSCLFVAAAQAAPSFTGNTGRAMPGVLPMPPGAGAGTGSVSPATSTPPGISGPNGEVGTETNGAPPPSAEGSTPSGRFTK